MHKALKILSVNTSDTAGGAARAAYRIHQGVQTLGVDSKMFVKDKRQDDDTVISLKQFVPTNIFYKVFDWVALKIKNKIQHYKWGKYPNRSKLYLSDSRGINIHNALQKIDYDVMHLHWINQRFIKLSDLAKVDKPIVWTLHDSWPFCGVCHYFFDCEKYQTKCTLCPYLNNPSLEKDLSTEVWDEKNNIYKNLKLHIVTPSKWLGDCANKSSLFGKFPVSVIHNCLDTDIFRPLKENEFSPRWAKISEKRLEKTFVLYGAVNAATDQRKGFANLLSAFQILEKQGKVNKGVEDPEAEEDDADALLDAAIELVVDMGQASASMLQRRFKIGYSRAGRIIDQMEARGIVSGYEGSKPRQVLITKEEWEELKMGPTININEED